MYLWFHRPPNLLPPPPLPYPYPYSYPGNHSEVSNWYCFLDWSWKTQENNDSWFVVLLRHYHILITNTITYVTRTIYSLIVVVVVLSLLSGTTIIELSLSSLLLLLLNFSVTPFLQQCQMTLFFFKMRIW